MVSFFLEKGKKLILFVPIAKKNKACYNEFDDIVCPIFRTIMED